MIKFAEGKVEEIIKDKNKVLPLNPFEEALRMTGNIVGCGPLPQKTGPSLESPRSDTQDDGEKHDPLPQKDPKKSGKRKLYIKKYCEKHKEELKRKRKEYYQANKEKWQKAEFGQPKREQPSCDCCGEKKGKLEINIIEDRPISVCEGCGAAYQKYLDETKGVLPLDPFEAALRMAGKRESRGEKCSHK